MIFHSSKFSLLIVLFVSCQTTYSGAEIGASSPALADVQTAINAANPGDAVVIPAGSATWSSTLSISKGIHLRGAGVGRTIITHLEVGIRVTGHEGVQWTISGLEMITPNRRICIAATGSCKNFRISYSKFEVPTGGAVTISIGQENDLDKHQYGLIDNCEFEDSRILIQAGLGEGSWKEPTNLGSDNAVYIEDCKFTYPNGSWSNVVDGNGGMRYVFRYNYVEDSYLEAHSLQNGWDNYFQRGSRLVEIYENDFRTIRDNYNHWTAMFIRAGTGVIFNNTSTHFGGSLREHMVVLDNRRTFRVESGNLGMADGSNPIDGNEEANGYPALDQIGRGQDKGPLGDPIPRYEATNRTPQALEPMYIWNNKLDGVVREPYVHNGCEIHIKKNRDFYTTPKSGYTPYTYPHPLRKN